MSSSLQRRRPRPEAGTPQRLGRRPKLRQFFGQTGRRGGEARPSGAASGSCCRRAPPVSSGPKASLDRIPHALGRSSTDAELRLDLVERHAAAQALHPDRQPHDIRQSFIAHQALPSPGPAGSAPLTLAGDGEARNPRHLVLPSPQPEADGPGPVRLGGAFGAQHGGQRLRFLQSAQECGLPPHHREVAGGEGGEGRDFRWRREAEVGAEGRLGLLRREVVERDLEDEAPEGRRLYDVQPKLVVQAKGSGWLSIQVSISFTRLTSQAPLRRSAGRRGASPSRRRSERRRYRGLRRKRRRSPFSVSSDPHRHQVRGALLHDLQAHALGEVANEGATCPSPAALAGRGRRAARRWPLGCPPVRPGRYRPGSARGRRSGGVPLRWRLAGEHAGEPAHSEPHRLDTATGDPCGCGSAGRHPRRRSELLRQRVGLAGPGLNCCGARAGASRLVP